MAKLYRYVPARCMLWFGIMLGVACLPCIQVAAQQAGQGEMVADVRVVGYHDVLLAKIVHFIKTRPGRAYDRRVIQEDIRRLNRSRMFASVSTENRRDAHGGLIVIFRVVERPVLQYIKYIGLRNTLEKTLAEETGLKVGQPVDPYAVTEGRRKIEEYYKAKGFNLVQVTIREGAQPKDRGAVYDINEGPQQQIIAIEFEGATIVSGRRLKTQIQTGSRWFGYFGGYLNRDQVDGDLKLLEKYYKNLGYLTVRISREFEFDDTQTACTLRFIIDEGPRCHVNSIQFIGVHKFNTADLQEKLLLKPGEPFDGAKLQQDKTILEQIYGSYGHVFADVKPEPRVSEDASQMDLVYVIEEGKRYRVRNIYVKIEGESPHTNIRTVLNRLELRPGDIVDVRKLRRSEARLQRSGLFEVGPGVRPHILIQPAGEGDEDEWIGSRPRRSRSRTGVRPGGSGSRGVGGFRGQSPDDWSPDDQFIDLCLEGTWKPNLPANSRSDWDSPENPGPAPKFDGGQDPVLPSTRRQANAAAKQTIRILYDAPPVPWRSSTRVFLR